MTKNIVKTSEIKTLREMGLDAREVVEYFIEKNNFLGDEKIMAIAVIKAMRRARELKKHITITF